MHKMKKDNKSNQNQLEAHPQKTGLQAANGKKRAINKVVNGEHGKGLCPTEVSPAPIQADKVWVIKSRKEKQEDRNKPKNHVEIEVKHPKAPKRPKPQFNEADGPAFELLSVPRQYKAGKRPTHPPLAPPWKTNFPPNPNTRYSWMNNYKSATYSTRPSPYVKYSPQRYQTKFIKREPSEYQDGHIESLPSFNTIIFKRIVTYGKIKRVAAVLKIQDQAVNDGSYILDVTSFELKPDYVERVIYTYLKHSLVSKDDGVCLFVPDLNDDEQTKEHFEELLKTKEVSVVKKVIPLNQLKTKYSSSEMKTKLANKYGVFLCDKTLKDEIIVLPGISFNTPTCKAFFVDLNAENLENEISKTMQKSAYKQGPKEHVTSIAVGTNKMTIDQVAANTIVVLRHLKNVYCGGLKNIRSMYLKKGTTSLPIYNSLCQPPILMPRTVRAKEGDMKKLIFDAKNVLSKLQRVMKAAGQKRCAVDDDTVDATNKTVKKSKSNDEGELEQVVELASAIQKLIREQKGDDEEDVDYNGENEDDDEDDDDENDDDEDDDDEDDDDEDGDDEDDEDNDVEDSD